MKDYAMNSLLSSPLFSSMDSKLQPIFSGPASIDQDEIELVKKIGEGTFGVVYEGTCRGCSVAIKIPKSQYASVIEESVVETFKEEVRIMSRIYSPYISLFMGVCTVPCYKVLRTTNQQIFCRIMIVTELLCGDVESLLKTKPFSLFERIKLAKDAAQGMAWLHGSESCILHRDLKLSNLLYDSNFRVKICDFGLSTIKPANKKLCQNDPPGNLLLMAPEILQGLHFNEKSEVYSFTLLLWQIVTRQEIFPHITEVGELIQAVCEMDQRPEIPRNCADSLRELLTNGWSPVPEARLSFKQIVSILDDVLIDVSIEDPVGRAFWRENFPSKFVVTPVEFFPAFEFYVHVLVTDNSNIICGKKCFQFLLIEKRDNREIVTIEKFGKILKLMGPMQVPHGKQGILTRISGLCSSGWFYGDMSADEALIKLSFASPGTFLIRFGNNPDYPNAYCISKVTRDRQVIHIRVIKTSDHKYQTPDGRRYNSWENLLASADHLHLRCSPEADPLLKETHPFAHIIRPRNAKGKYVVLDPDTAEKRPNGSTEVSNTEVL